MSGWRTTSCTVTSAVAVLALAACGSGARQDVAEPTGNFPVRVTAATFPRAQRLAQHARLVIEVRNTGLKTIPNIAVTITNPRYGTAVQPFGTFLHTPGVANHSRPVWIVERPPGPCGYSCTQGGPGVAVTADPHTWALGPLRSGASAKFVWAVTAVKSGTYPVRWQVAAGLNGKAKAVLVNGSEPAHTFFVHISAIPPQQYVNANGQVVTTG